MLSEFALPRVEASRPESPSFQWRCFKGGLHNDHVNTGPMISRKAARLLGEAYTLVFPTEELEPRERFQQPRKATCWGNTTKAKSETYIHQFEAVPDCLSVRLKRQP